MNKKNSNSSSIKKIDSNSDLYNNYDSNSNTNSHKINLYEYLKKNLTNKFTYNNIDSSIKKKSSNNSIKNAINILNDYPYKEFEMFNKYSKIFIFLLIILSIFSLIIFILTSLLIFYGGFFLCITILIISLISIINYFFGIYTIIRNNRLFRKIYNSYEDPEKILQSKERIYLFIFIYILLLNFTFFLINGFGLLLFKENIIMDIKAKGYDYELWKKNFNNYSYHQVINNFKKINNSIGSLLLIECSIILFLFIFIFLIIFNYRTLKKISNCFIMIYLQLIFVFIYYSSTCLKFKTVLSINENIKEWPITCLFILSIVLIIYNLLVFFSINLELKKLCLHLIRINLLLFIIFNIFIVFLLNNNKKFKNKNSTNCVDLFRYLDETFLLEKIKCKSKYLFTFNDLNNVDCPKNRIVLYWEKMEKELNNNFYYGCYDNTCCLNVYSFIKSIYNYLGLIAAFLIIFLIFFFVIEIYFYLNFNKKYDYGTKDKNIIKFYLFFVTIVIIIIIILIIIYYKKPKTRYIDQIKIKENDKNDLLIPSEKIFSNFNIDSLFTKNLNDLNSNFIFNFQNEQNDYYKCYIVSNNINITINNINNNKIVNYRRQYKNNYNYIKYMIKYYDLNNSLRNFNLIPYNYFDYINFTIKIYNDYEDNDSDNNNYEEDDIKEYNNEYLIYNKTYDLSLINESSSFYIYGNLSEDFIKENNITNNDISAYLSNYKYLNNSPILYNNNINSDFSFKIGPLYEFLNEMFYELNLTLKYNTNNNTKKTNLNNNNNNNNYIKYENTYKISNFGFYPYYKFLYNISLPLNKIVQYNVSGYVYYESYGSLQGLEDVKIYVYNSTVDNNIFNKEPNSNVFNNYLNILYTNDKGFYQILINNTGEYTLIYEKKYYTYNSQNFIIYDNKNNNNNNIINYELRFITLNRLDDMEINIKLTWNKGPNDLDLNSKFQISEDYYCKIFFGNTNCGEVSYINDNRLGGEKGIEKIKIKKFSKFLYLFYVSKYTDIAKTYAKNENKIEEISNIDKENYIEGKENDDINLIDSYANIKVYNGYYFVPIINIDIPQLLFNENENIKNEKDNYKYWIAFCINGNKGINSLKVVNKMSKEDPDINICKQYYNKEDLYFR